MPESNDLLSYALTIRMVSSDHVVTHQVAPYHPESAPGPHDSDELFDHFIEMMGEG